MPGSQRLMPCLWFDGTAEEAARFYVSVFPDSRIDHVHKSTIAWPAGKPGDTLLVEFTILGQRHQALNGGPNENARFNESVSLSVACEDQAEVDRYWNALIADGGRPIQCGWLADRYGLRWQIVPRLMSELLADPDRARAKRAMEAMLHMVKLDVAALDAAAKGG